MILDPTTSIGKIRLRVGDYSDLPVMPDSVYSSALEDSDNNLPRASLLMATYILGALTGQTRQKISQIEVFGNEWFSNYLAFIKNVILNPSLMQIAPVPYTPITTHRFGNQIEVPLVQFQKDWNNNYSGGTEAEQTRLTGQLSYPGYERGSNYYF